VFRAPDRRTAQVSNSKEPIMRHSLRTRALTAVIALPPALFLCLLWGHSREDVAPAAAVTLTGGIDSPGACCVIQAAVTCFEGTLADCQAFGGTFLGPNSVCQGHEPCCLPDGSCLFIDRACCLDLGGHPQGADTDCILIKCAPIETGACCVDIDDGPLAYDTCFISGELACRSAGGFFQGAGSTCTTEACCLPNGFCQPADPECCEASGGVALGAGTNCTGINCSPLGACCFDIDDGPLAYDTCIITDPLSCESDGGFFQGVGSTCTLEACCLPTGFCQDTDPDCCVASNGCPQGPGTTCAADDCPCPGDTNNDDVTDIDDIVNVVLCFGTEGIDCPDPGDKSDVTFDGIVDIDDIVWVVLNFGSCKD
jgi:hypothetical protein